MLDSSKYSDQTKFLEDGTKNIQSLKINKTILNQKNFKLSQNLQELILNPVNHYSPFFELKFEQFLFVIESMAANK
jgi:hypothetical protein